MTLGEWASNKYSKDTYTPQYSGKWVNHGTAIEEDWIWEENLEPFENYFINVYNTEEGMYVAKIGTSADNGSIETVECGEYRYVDFGLRLLSAYYNAIGEFSVEPGSGSEGPDSLPVDTFRMVKLEPDLEPMIISRNGVRIEYYNCPKCYKSNTSDRWDITTKLMMGIQETDEFMSSSASKVDHEELETIFICPSCNEEIQGIDLIKED
ncbi:hypothetical protein MHZ92_07900 [Sporosarcina sp. ACRSL]|uniref:hypothetical protein n=1 Tax=Sporosarcina sp. ACRSL TaxID=2918215 RepID=UPI001EF4C6B6|nr:hypothetical protein [Sporosarcina sp. ACRSL]MCG7344051.1 hypothetical protein [Sporosarcina sp. ACRSL]